MPDVNRPESDPDNRALRDLGHLAELAARIGWENVRLMKATPITEWQREQIAAIVRDAPRRPR
jgi:hypothetical protein